MPIVFVFFEIKRISKAGNVFVIIFFSWVLKIVDCTYGMEAYINSLGTLGIGCGGWNILSKKSLKNFSIKKK